MAFAYTPTKPTPKIGTPEYLTSYSKQFGGGADPYKVVNSIGGQQFNAAGDIIPARPAPAAQPNYSKQLDDLLRQIQAANRPVYAPKLDYASINAKARSQAQKAVNPLYTRKLNDFLAEQSAKRQRQQEQYATTSKILEEDLTQSLEASNLQRGRTTEDVATSSAQSKAQEEQFQQDTGTEFEDARIAAAREQAVAGTLGTGAGQRQTTQIAGARNTQEQRQVQQFEQNRAAQELFKTRTFEDLIKSDDLSKLKTSRGKEQAKFDLDNYLQDLKFEEKSTRSQLEEERQKFLQSEVANQRSQLVTNFIGSIGSDAQRDAAYRAYGSLL